MGAPCGVIQKRSNLVSFPISRLRAEGVFSTAISSAWSSSEAQTAEAPS
jgi:hypothetical protein